MSDLGQAAALVLAGVFAWAGVAKARQPGPTAASFDGLGLPRPRALARVVPAVELGVAVAMVVAPVPAAWAALVLLAAFSVVLIRAVARGATVTCACFGGGSGAGADTRPVSSLELVRNGGLGGLALVASGAGGGTALWPSLPASVIVTVLVALVRVAFAAVELRQQGGHLLATPLPGEEWRR